MPWPLFHLRLGVIDFRRARSDGYRRVNASATRDQSLPRETKLDVANVNSEYGDVDRVPIRLVTKPIKRKTLGGFYRTARLTLVTPLRDGMNFFAKECVAAQDTSNSGVLIFSCFDGAAYKLEEALLVIRSIWTRSLTRSAPA